jgi:hypothetical protein
MAAGVEGDGEWFGVRGRGATGVSGTGSAGGVGVQGDGQVGVQGLDTTNAGVGIRGLASNGLAVCGIVSGEGTGVFGFSPHPKNIGPLGWAGRFEGAVNVTGPVHKSGGGFRIDHPLEPETKYLDHSFVESDEMKNLYDGIAELDADGRAVVTLPPWFEALNADFRYQLTAIAAPAPEIHVSREFAEGSFEIAGGHAGQRICWQITGRRHDRWARAHQNSPEIDKAEVERGHYRHPELYDLPPERGIAYALFGESIEAHKRIAEVQGESERLSGSKE